MLKSCVISKINNTFYLFMPFSLLWKHTSQLRFLLFILVFFFAIDNLYAKKHTRKNADPEKVPQSLKRKIKRLTKGDTLDRDKFMHICEWIIRKKRYDTKGFESIRLETYSVKEIARKRRLLCREYTELLYVMCKEAGVVCYKTDGYIKGAWHYPWKRFYFQEHAWNVVYWDSSYHTADITWAAGYARPKVSLWGRLRLLFKFPYTPSRWKFVYQPKPYYLDIPVEELTATHLPVTPMWQLSRHPLSMKQFEEDKEVTDTAGKYNFESEIQSYNSFDKQGQLMETTIRGYDFNKKNNYHRGAGFLRYAYNYWNSFDGKKLPANEMLMKGEQLKPYAQEAEVYLKKFLDDNKKIRWSLNDSMKLKSREVLAFINTHQRLSGRKIVEANAAIRANNRRNLNSDLTITRKQRERTRNTDSDPIFLTKRNDRKKSNADQLVLLNKAIQKNDSLVQVFKELLPDLEAISKVRDTVVCLHDSVISYERWKIKQVRNAMGTDLATNDKLILREYHQFIDNTLQSSINLYEKEFKRLDAPAYLKLIRYRDSLSYAAIRLIAGTKRLLINHKRLSFDKKMEDALFLEQNQKLHLWYNELENTQHCLKRISNENSAFYQEWKAQLKTLNKQLTRYQKFENYVCAKSIEREKYRFRKYDYAGRKAIRNAIVLKIKAAVMVNNANSLLKPRKR